MEQDVICLQLRLFRREVKDEYGSERNWVFLRLSAVNKRQLAQYLVTQNAVPYRVFRCVESIMSGMHTLPWAIVCFPGSYRLAGHIAHLRRDPDDLRPCSYKGYSEPFVPGIGAPDVSIVLVRSKSVLARASAQSPLFHSPWNALKHRDEAHHWICLAAAPPADWMTETTRGDDERFEAAVKALQLPLDPVREHPEFKAARDAHDEERHADMLRHATALVEACPHRPLAHSMQGDALLLLGLHDQAMLSYRLAISKDHTHYSTRATSRLLDFGRPADHQATEQELQQHSKRLQTLLILALESTEAVESAWIGMGAIHHEQGHTQEAIRLFRRAADNAPGRARAWNCLGTLYEEMGSTSEAVQACERLVEAAEDDATAWRRLAVAYGKDGKHDEATRAIRKSIELGKDTPANRCFLGLSVTQMAGGHGRTADGPEQLRFGFDKVVLLEYAIEAFRRALRLEPDFGVAWLLLGETCIGAERFAEAIVALKRAVEIKPENASAHNALGLAFARAHCPNKAMDHCKTAVSLNPESAEIWDSLGCAYTEAGLFNEAVQALKKALELKPDYPEALCNLGVAYLRSGRQDRFSKVLDRLHQVDAIRARQLRDMADLVTGK